VIWCNYHCDYLAFTTLYFITVDGGAFGGRLWWPFSIQVSTGAVYWWVFTVLFTDSTIHIVHCILCFVRWWYTVFIVDHWCIVVFVFNFACDTVMIQIRYSYFDAELHSVILIDALGIGAMVGIVMAPSFTGDDRFVPSFFFLRWFTIPFSPLRMIPFDAFHFCDTCPLRLTFLFCSFDAISVAGI